MKWNSLQALTQSSLADWNKISTTLIVRLENTQKRKKIKFEAAVSASLYSSKSVSIFVYCNMANSLMFTKSTFRAKFCTKFEIKLASLAN